jgi:hypothetical protein
MTHLNNSLLRVRTSVWGESKVQEFICDGPMKEAHCKKKISTWDEPPQLTYQ